MPNKKRFIVIYKNQECDMSEAAQILSTNEDNLLDAVHLMSTDKDIKESDINHFEELGSTAISLSQREVKKLKQDDRVEDVVESIMVYPDQDFVEEDENIWNYDDLLDRYFNTDDYMDVQNYTYEDGYIQAIEDLHGYLGESFGNNDVRNYPNRPFEPRNKFGLSLRESRLHLRKSPWVLRHELPKRAPVSWNIQMTNANKVWRRVTGRGVKVAVLDTGININHPDLIVRGGVSFVPRVESWNDDNGHGTHCAGTIGAKMNSIGVVGIAPECELYAVKVLPKKGPSPVEVVIAGMNWALRNRMDVVSMSLGSPVRTSDTPCYLPYERAAQRLNSVGCTVVSSAGNSGRTSRPWVGRPARCPSFMAVAAVDRNGSKADFSSIGPELEISAPGVNIPSTFLGSSYRNSSGTSMACPHVSGAVALLKQLRPGATPNQIRSRLRMTAKNLGVPGHDTNFGFGLLDCFSAVFS